MRGPVWGGPQAAGKRHSQPFCGKRLPHPREGSRPTKPVKTRRAFSVQEEGCGTRYSMCWGTNAAALAHQECAAEAGAVEAVAAAMQAHPQAVGVQEWGCTALCSMCYDGDAAGLARFSARRRREHSRRWWRRYRRICR